MINVLVVDDQVLIRAGLSSMIRAAPGLDVVGEASSGEEAVQFANSLPGRATRAAPAGRAAGPTMTGGKEETCRCWST